jgi:hypothetical protein
MNLGALPFNHTIRLENIWKDTYQTTERIFSPGNQTKGDFNFLLLNSSIFKILTVGIGGIAWCQNTLLAYIRPWF